MRITCRTLVILLLITVLIMAYCSTSVDANAITRLAHKRPLRARRPTGKTYKVVRKTKIKTKTKIRYGAKKPSLLKKIKHRG